jgi:CDP-glycerol glycerophosphotransferase (TagB/SpsB family)
VTLLLNPNPLSIRETELKEYVEAFRETSWRPVLRLHPAESREQLEELWRTIAPESLRDLTVISQKESLGEILQGSNVAITYDSTAGLEAMLLGIPVVVYGSHFHPTASPYPVWDELRPLNDPETLREALRHIQGDPSLHSRIIAFQDRYAETVNGRLDGRATKRLTELVLRVASTRGIAATHRPDALSRPEAGARDLSPR